MLQDSIDTVLANGRNCRWTGIRACKDRVIDFGPEFACDRLDPQCSNCQNANIRCETSSPKIYEGYPRGYTRSLETEIQAKEITCSHHLYYQAQNFVKQVHDCTIPYSPKGYVDSRFCDARLDYLMMERS